MNVISFLPVKDFPCILKKSHREQPLPRDFYANRLMVQTKVLYLRCESEIIIYKLLYIQVDGRNQKVRGREQGTIPERVIRVDPDSLNLFIVRAQAGYVSLRRAMDEDHVSCRGRPGRGV